MSLAPHPVHRFTESWRSQVKEPELIRLLPSRWRKDAGVFARLDLWELSRVLERCARELEEALSAASAQTTSAVPCSDPDDLDRP